MAAPTIRTRFAPSPSGALHLGNARTALFNWLYARRHGGRFVLRSEDTDAGRRAGTALLTDLEWLGLAPDEGPQVGGPYGPYRQSARAADHARDLERLRTAGHAYPCYCTRAELDEARRRQLAAGRPPRYPGTCRDLGAAARAARERGGRIPALRFRVPETGETAFDDLVLGHQCVHHADLGDFVIARSDGSPGFLFANAVDDAHMRITHVLRGDDHLSNTPRQLLVLSALELAPPTYGHFGLVLGDDGRPLSKRGGAASLADLRAAGYRPEAVVNHLARIGFAPAMEGLADAAALATAFDPGRVARGSARHDRAALDRWQRQAVDRLDDVAVWDWIAAYRPADAPELPVSGPCFAAAVRANVVLPRDAWAWARALFDEEAGPDAAARAEIAAAGPVFFRAALGVTEPGPRADFRGWVRAVGRAAGVSGRALYRPLRAALTNAVEGPELAAVVPLLPEGLVRRRLQACAAD